MRRLVTLIAVLFAFAAVGGVATTNAMAFSSIAPVLSQTASCSDAAPMAAAVQFKSCGKKRSGLVMPCPPQIGMLVSVQVVLPAQDGPQYRLQQPLPLVVRTRPVDQRPPIAA
ncbi:MAG: hypothetical protein ACOH2L_08055 [Devosia sp.]